MMKRGVARINPPIIPRHLPREYGPASLEEVRMMVDHTAQLPEMSYEYRYGELDGIVPREVDGLDVDFLHQLGESPSLYDFRGAILI